MSEGRRFIPSIDRKPLMSMSVTVLGMERLGGKEVIKVQQQGKEEYIYIDAGTRANYQPGTKLSFDWKSVKNQSSGRNVHPVYVGTATIEAIGEEEIPWGDDLFGVPEGEWFGSLEGSVQYVEEPEHSGPHVPLEGEKDGEMETVLAESLRDIAASDPSRERLALAGLPRYAVGVIERSDDDHQAYIRLDQARGYTLPQRIEYGGTAPAGMLVVISPDVQNEEVAWTVERPLGLASDVRASMEALAYRTGRDLEFPEGPRKEAERIESELHEMGAEAFMEREINRSHYEHEGGPKAEAIRLVTNIEDYVHGESRLDLRDVPDMQIFGIDPETARDHDDIVSREELSDGTVRVGVHIANVDHFAYPGTALDQEAEQRQFTLYLPELTVPVYPEVLSAELCSLKPGETRIAESVIFTFYPDGRKTVWHGSTVVRSQQQFSYAKADQALAAGAGSYHDSIKKLVDQGLVFNEARERRGAITFEDSNGERGPTSHMIEAWMLEANSAVGGVLIEGEEHEESVVFERVHTPPPVDQLMRLLRDMRDFDRRFETRFGTAPDPLTAKYVRRYEDALARDEGNPERQRILASLDAERNDMVNLIHARNTGTTDERALGFAEKMKSALRKISKPAQYSLQRGVGHAALKLIPYVHFTSPIRRKPDTHIKRLRDAKLTTRPVTYENEVAVAALEESVARANLMDAMIGQSERDAYDIVELHSLEDAGFGKTYSHARVIGYARKGRGVLVSLSRTPRDRYAFFVPWRTLIGSDEPERGTFRPGTKLGLTLEDVDYAKREAVFSLAAAAPYERSKVRRTAPPPTQSSRNSYKGRGRRSRSR